MYSDRLCLVGCDGSVDELICTVGSTRRTMFECGLGFLEKHLFTRALAPYLPPFYQLPLSLRMQADRDNHLVRRIDLSLGLVSTLAGTSGVSGSANGAGTAALFFRPSGVAMDAAGTVALVVSGAYRRVMCVTADGRGWRENSAI